MKKLIYLLMVSALVITSACNPMDDINAELDAQVNPIVGDATYTLTDEDYSELELNYGSFSNLEDAKSMIPGFLSEKYPIWGKGSSVLVGYKLYIGNAPGVSDYTNAVNYNLTNTDYPGYGDNAIGFYPTENPSDYLGDVLAAQISNPTEGQNVLVKYKQYVGETVFGISNYYDADFQTNGTLLDYETVSIVGDNHEWTETNSYGAKMSGFSYPNAIPNEDWLVSSEIDLTNQTNLTFQVNQAINYASGQLDLLNVLVSTNYTGDVTTATWDTITLTNTPPGTNWTYVLSDEYDFSSYEGQKIHIAFKYESTDTVGATWEIGQVLIKTPGVEGNTVSHQKYYTYNGGEWVPAEGVYYLSAADFDSMGEGSGQPGQYNNFSSSVSPDAYLPTFLGIKYPYAMEGDELFVIYPYYSSSSGAQTRGNLYTVINGVWTGFKSTIDTTLQFAHDGSVWVPDNTIKYTLTGADYSFIVSSYGDTYPTQTGNMDSYGNFNGFSWTPEMILDVINGVLFNNYPNAQEGQKFSVTYSIYDGSTHDATLYLILSGGEYVNQ